MTHTHHANIRRCTQCETHPGRATDMTDRTNHRAEAERLLADADDWGQQAEEPMPEVGEMICLAYSAIHALLAIHDAVTAPDRYPANEARQRAEASLSVSLSTDTIVRQSEPDLLDENDHRDRVDRDGDPWFRNPGGCWHAAQCDCLGCNVTLAHLNNLFGPLAFAPDASLAPQDAAQDAAKGESDAVEGGGPAGPPEALLCHECGHDIDRHVPGLGCLDPGPRPCTLSASGVARELIEQAVAKAGRRG